MKWLMLKYTYKTKEGRKWGKFETLSQATQEATCRLSARGPHFAHPCYKGTAIRNNRGGERRTHLTIFDSLR